MATRSAIRTADYTILAADIGSHQVFTTSVANRLCTLPAASTMPLGFLFKVTHDPASTGSNTLTVVRNGSDTIQAVAGNKVIPKGTSVFFESNGVDGWFAFTPADATGGTIVGNLTLTGHLLASPDATYDIGASGATRFRDLFLSRNIVLGGTISFGGTTSSFPALKSSSAELQARLADDSAYADFRVQNLYALNILPTGSLLFPTLGGITFSSDGVMKIADSAATAFNRLQFGGTTSSFPALKRTGTGLDVRLADDSAYSLMTLGSMNMSRSSAGGGGLTFVDTNGGGQSWQWGPGAGTGSPTLFGIYNNTTPALIFTLSHAGIFTAYSNIVAHGGTAIPAGGTTGAGYKFSSTANFGMFFGSGLPTLDAAEGSLYLRSDGAPYYNSSSGSGTTWTQIGTGSGGSVSAISEFFDGTGAQTAFVLTGSPTDIDDVDVFISGLRQAPVADYTLSGSTLTFLVAPSAGTDNIYVRWHNGASSGTPADAVSQTFNGDSSTTAFTLSANPSNAHNLDIFISGVRQTPNVNYSVSGTTLTFASAPPTGTNNILARWYEAMAIGATQVSTTTRYSGTGAQTAYTLSVDPVGIENTMVYVEGIYQNKDTYTVVGTTLTFTTAPPSGTDNIEVMTVPFVNFGYSAAPQVTATNGIFVNSNTINSNYTIAAGTNAVSVGPVTIAPGVTVTVAPGSRWVVL